MLAVQATSGHKKRSAVSRDGALKCTADVEAAVTSDDGEKRPPDVPLEGRELLMNVFPACAVAALGAFQFGYHLAVRIRGDVASRCRLPRKPN